MRKIFYANDLRKSWGNFSKERQKERDSLAKLSYGEKLDIMEEMRVDTGWFRQICSGKIVKSKPSPKPSKT